MRKSLIASALVGLLFFAGVTARVEAFTGTFTDALISGTYVVTMQGPSFPPAACTWSADGLGHITGLGCAVFSGSSSNDYNNCSGIYGSASVVPFDFYGFNVSCNGGPDFIATGLVTAISKGLGSPELVTALKIVGRVGSDDFSGTMTLQPSP